MFIWVAFALITAVTLICLLWPFLGKQNLADHVRSFDARVYKDQLAEIDADTERGIISATEAEAAKIEISRRLLSLPSENEFSQVPHRESEEAARPSTSSSSSRQILAGSILFVPAFTLAFYLTFGAPLIPGQPHAQRAHSTTEGGQSIQVLIAKVEHRLKNSPNDLKGWTLIAPIYMRLQRFQDAKNAYRQVIRLSGENPENLMRLGEAIVFENNGIVNSATQEIFEKVVATNSSDRQAGFWLALAKEQKGEFAEAVQAWQALLATGEADAPWRPLVEKHLKYSQSEIENKKDLGNKTKISGNASATNTNGETATRTLRGPTKSDIASAKSMTADERSAMISQMVEGLDQRLNSEGGSLREWQRLIRAYMVLDKKDAAQNAYDTARQAFINDKDALKKLTEFVKSLGLKT